MAEPSQHWRTYSREALDRQYDARGSVASFEAEYANYLEASAPALRDPRRKADLVFDEASGERLDLYSAGEGTALFLWIHGGYWRASSKTDNAFIATGFLAHGISVAILDYTLAPKASLDEIVRQVRQGVAFLHRNGARHGMNTQRIHVGGSSAGGHLTGMLLASDWQHAHGLPDDVIGVALGLSGLFDVEPLIDTQVNTWMTLDGAAVRRNSPIRLIPPRSEAHFIASVGGLETDEFRRQTSDFATAFARSGRTDVVPMPGHNHFDIALSLSAPDGLLCRTVASSIRS